MRIASFTNNHEYNLSYDGVYGHWLTLDSGVPNCEARLQLDLIQGTANGFIISVPMNLVSPLIVSNLTQGSIKINPNLGLILGN